MYWFLALMHNCYVEARFFCILEYVSRILPKFSFRISAFLSFRVPLVYQLYSTKVQFQDSNVRGSAGIQERTSHSSQHRTHRGTTYVVDATPRAIAPAFATLMFAFAAVWLSNNAAPIGDAYAFLK